MMLKGFVFLLLIRYVLVMDSHKFTNLFKSQRSCSNIEYYDRFHHKCQSFPGGGYLVIEDHSAKCTDGDTGLHTFNRNDFYYFCSPDGVMIGMCPKDMKFNETLGRCVQPANKTQETIRIYDESENCNVMIPNCNRDGKFPVPSNCSFYYDCQRNNHNYLQYVYKCPYETMFHPDLHRCVTMTKCYVDHYDILDHFDNDYFPKCIMQGQFRTSRHCNLFYRCIPNMDGSFFQIRYECPPMMYYNIGKERCFMGYYTNCEHKSWDKIVKDYATKHNLEIDNSVSLQTTPISTLNTTITTSCPCSCTSTTRISLSSNKTYSTIQSIASTEIPRTVTRSSTIFKTEVIDSSKTSSVTESETNINTDAPNSLEPKIERDTTFTQTVGITTTKDTQTETTHNQTSILSTAIKGHTKSVTLESSNSTRGYSGEAETSSSAKTEETSTSITSKTPASVMNTTREAEQRYDSTKATSTTFASKQTTESTTEVSYSSKKPTVGNINTTSFETYTTAPIYSKQTTENSTETVSVSTTSQRFTTMNNIGKSAEVSTKITIISSQSDRSSASFPFSSKQPTTSTAYFKRTTNESSSEEYDSYEDFTWDDVAWHRHHSTSKIPSGYPTPSTEKPRVYFHLDSPPFEYPDSNYWDDSHSQEATKSSKSTGYSSTTLIPQKNSTSTPRLYQRADNESSTTLYSDISSSTHPLSSHVVDLEFSELDDSNSRPVICHNNPLGGLTCDGVKGKAGGWFDLPGYLLRYRKRSGEDTTPDKKFNGEVNLRLRYPNAYKLEAYPKQKRRVKKPDSQ